MILIRRLPRPPQWLEYAVLVVILCTALWLRVYRLAELPYGPYYDEGANVILAGEISTGRYLPVFIEPYTGKEVLFFYLAAGLMRLVGISTWALRLTSALVGVASVLMAYVLTRELFADEPLIEARWLALLTAGLMAVSFWPMAVSRYGYRANTLPLTQSLMLWALWRGLGARSTRQRQFWAALAGMFCGLTAYTYLSSRFVPVALALVWGLILAADRGRVRRRLVQLVLFGLAALVVFAPLGWFFYTHPQTLTVRLSQVTDQGGLGNPNTLLQSSLRALEMFTRRGDPQVRFGVPQQPVFAGPLGWLFYAGVLTAAVRLFGFSGPRGRVRYLLLAIWILVMLAPSVLAVPYEIPHSLRSIGVMPLMYAVTALGGVAVLSLAYSYARRHPAALQAAAAAGILAVLGAGGAATFYNYFVTWASMPAAYYDLDGDMADAARYLDGYAQADAPAIYVASHHYRHPTVAALARNYDRIKWLTDACTLVFPPLTPGQAALFVFPYSAMPEANWLARYFPPESQVAQHAGPDGQVAYRAYLLHATPIISPQHMLPVTFGGAIELLGYDLLRPAYSGQQANLALYWRVLRQPERGDYQFFGELTDAWGIELAKHNSFTYPSEQWAPGEVIVDWWRVPIPPGAPPGDYALKVGVWSPADSRRLTATDAQGRFAGTTARLSPVRVDPPRRVFQPGEVDIAHRLNVNLGKLTLLGYVQWPDEVRQGETLFVGLYWQALQAPTQDRNVRIGLRGEATYVLLYEGAPVHGTLPMTAWLPGQIVADLSGLRIPPDAPPGRYTVQVELGDAGAQPLGSVTVEATQRSFDAPPIPHPLNAHLGEQVELLGYALGADTVRPGQMAQATLYWRALAPMEAEYTVFVHLLDKTGTLRAQRDNPPVGGTYPTTLWMPGEVVADEYEIALPIDLPAGTYTLIAGMYEPETGARLPTGSADYVVLGTVHVAP